MCNFDDGDFPEVWRTSTPRARKSHQCDECRRAIQPGETYTRDFSVYDGRADTFITCGHCYVARAWLIENCGAWSSGFSDLMIEHAREYPDIKFGLLRIVFGMRRQWKRFDGGGLMKVQPMPRSIEEAMREAA